jgi:hypothetical protein
MGISSKILCVEIIPKMFFSIMFNADPDSQLISTVFSLAIYHGALEIFGLVELRGLLEKVGDWESKLSGKGCHGLSSLDCQDLLNSFIEQYGLLATQGICVRLGRVIYQYLRRNNPEIIINNSMEKRMQSLDNRISNELEVLTQCLQKNMACQIGMEKENKNWIIRMNLFEKYHPEINKISFYFFNGILQECLEWMDSRHRYRIEMLFNPIDDHDSYRISISYQSID